MASIPTQRRLEYAQGYIALGMVDAASDELEAIDGADRLSLPVISVRMQLYNRARQWDMVAYMARAISEVTPGDAKVWIEWAAALHELKRTAEARDILLRAEPMHNASALLHYNLACYHCLLGDLPAAKRYIANACELDWRCKADALDDADLKPLWSEVESL